MKSSHLIWHDLDWIHYGFATLAIDREEVGKIMNCKTSLSIRGYDIALYTLNNSKVYLKVWNKIDKFHVISADLLEQAKFYGLERDTYRIIPPAIDISSLPMPSFKELDQKMLFRIVIVGRMNWKKGGEFMLEVLFHLKKKFDIKVDWIGHGEDFERLAFARYQLNLVQDVTFHGKLPQKEVFEIINRNNFLLHLSIQEGFSNAVLEAQALEVIPIVSDAEGLPENVLDRATGFVTKRLDLNHVISVFEEISQMDTSDLRQMARRARTRVVDHFSLNMHLQKFGEFFKR